MPQPTQSLEACYARLVGDQLFVGNALIERSWRIENGLLHALSLEDRRTGTSWVAEPCKTPAPLPRRELPTEPRTATLAVSRDPTTTWQAESLLATLTATGASTKIIYKLRIFPASASVSMQLTATGTTPASPAASDPAKQPITDTLEAFTCSHQHVRLVQATLHDSSDHHNELVHEREWLIHPADAGLELRGCVFVLEDSFTGDGVIFLKEAPLPEVRPAPTPADFRVSAGWLTPLQFALLGQGTGDDAWDTTGYRHVAIVYDGGRAGRVRALQQYQRQLRTYVPGRDGRVVCNYWGDRSRDVVVHEAFYLKEADAVAKLDAEVVQIDSGWHIGRVADNIDSKGKYEGFWEHNPQFWDVDTKRFPRGLQPVVDAARKHGLGYGLWFAPDSVNDFANWKRDADRVLELHHAHGIDYFKIDYMMVRSRAGERNLHSLVDAILMRSQGKIVIDLDITAGNRPGYYGMHSVGTLFVENRYTDWHRYWPHQTLRNTWKLAHWVDPRRLRMEFLNTARHADRYPNDPLAPAQFSPQYCFATVMFTSPLGWFEAQNLPASYVENASQLIRTWREHRDAILTGTIIPIGDEPDGTSWTGFVSYAENAGGGTPTRGYALVFRELNDRSSASIELPLIAKQRGVWTVRKIAGEGEATICNGTINASLASPGSFLLASFDAK